MQRLSSFFRLTLSAVLLFSSMGVTSAGKYDSLNRSNKTFHRSSGIIGKKSVSLGQVVKPLALRTRFSSSSAVRTSAVSNGLRSGVSRLFGSKLRNSINRTNLTRASLFALGAAAISACGGGGGSSGGGSVPVCANELDIFNDSVVEGYQVYIDGFFAADIDAGFVKTFCLSSGFHTVEIYDSINGDLIFSDTVSFVGSGNFESWSVSDPYEAVIELENNTGGYVSLYVGGTFYDDVPPGVWNYPTRQGSRWVTIEDYEDGETLYDSFDSFTGGFTYIYDITDAICSTLSIWNDTGEAVWVYVDGVFQAVQGWDTIYDYSFNDDYHRVEVVAASDGFVFYDSYDYYGCGFYTLDLH